MADQGSYTQAHRQGWWLWRINPMAVVLWPLSLVFCMLVILRRNAYQRGWWQSQRLERPLLVVGNLSIGGSGKTPLVVAMTQLLIGRGYRVGLMCRGYKSDIEHDGMIIEPGQRNPAAGDEANLLASLCDCPVGVGADRYRVGQRILAAHPELDLLISDDGLQHYALARDLEILVMRQAALGNGWCLPAGPLREPLGRGSSCDLVIDRDGDEVREQLGDCWNLADPGRVRPLEYFQGEKVFALAGIGFPDAFFGALEARGLELIATAFPDHYAFSEGDITGFSGRPLLVTHKDAVKLEVLADAGIADNIWVVPLELSLSGKLQHQILQLLETKIHGQALT
jgi:tetraacyldisaccharide 4'-kinase